MIKILFCIFIMFAQPLQANSGSFTINSPKNWKVSKELFGMPYSILGPRFENSNRPVITVNPIAHKDFPINFFKKSEYFQEFKKNKAKWAKRTNGEILRINESKLGQKLKQVPNYAVEVSYTLNKTGYHEKTLFVKCPKKLFAIKTLIPLIVLNKFEQDVINTMESFRCE